MKLWLCNHGFFRLADLATLALSWFALLLLVPSGEAAEGKACAAEPTDMFIGYGDLINCSIGRVNDEDIFRFRGGSGETISVHVSDRGGIGRACFRLNDPDGVALGGGRCANSSGDYLLQRSGTYTLVLADQFSDQTVDYALDLERIDPVARTARPIRYNQNLTGEVAGVADVDLIYFQGRLNTRVRVSISDRGGIGRSCFRVYSPDGVALDGGRCANSNGEYSLLQTGPYTVVLTDQFSDQTVQYTLSLACISGNCRNLSIPDVEGCVAMKGTALANKQVTLTQPDTAAKRTRTDVRGCYSFGRVPVAKGFTVRIKRPKAQSN